MIRIQQVTSPPPTPLLVYDGECGFCVYWIQRWQRTGSGEVSCLPFQSPQFSRQFPDLPRDQVKEAVQLIETDGRIYHGADAVFQSWVCRGSHAGWLWLYRKAPGFAAIARWSYRFIARHRRAFSALTRWLMSKERKRSPAPKIPKAERG